MKHYVWGIVSSRGGLYPYTLRPSRGEAVRQFIASRTTGPDAGLGLADALAFIKDEGVRVVKFLLTPVQRKP